MHPLSVHCVLTAETISGEPLARFLLSSGSATAEEAATAVQSHSLCILTDYLGRLEVRGEGRAVVAFLVQADRGLLAVPVEVRDSQPAHRGQAGAAVEEESQNRPNRGNRASRCRPAGPSVGELSWRTGPAILARPRNRGLWETEVFRSTRAEHLGRVRPPFGRMSQGNRKA
jgi:hypothetical protein